MGSAFFLSTWLVIPIPACQRTASLKLMMQRTPFLLPLSQTWAQVKFLISCVIFASKEGIQMPGTIVHVVILTPVLQVFYCLCCCCCYYYYYYYYYIYAYLHCGSQWPRGGSVAARLLGLWVRIPPLAWMTHPCACFVLSSRGLCEGLNTRPEESNRVLCVWVWLRSLDDEEALAQ